MSTNPYVDIHTHRRNCFPDAFSVFSLSVEEITSGYVGGNYRTAAVHPWWVEDYPPEKIDQLKAGIQTLVEEKKLWGIGETGIDLTQGESLDFQKSLFIWHMELSEKNHLPLILHSVRAGHEFLHLLKKHRPQSPWIFHDFRGNISLVKDLLRLHPRCYFSFGLSVDNSPQIRELLPQLPLERIFLETDEQKHLDIHDIYIRASAILGVELDDLKDELWKNFRSCHDLAKAAIFDK